jgi:hypothetical protein
MLLFGVVACVVLLAGGCAWLQTETTVDELVKIEVGAKILVTTAYGLDQLDKAALEGIAECCARADDHIDETKTLDAVKQDFVILFAKDRKSYMLISNVFDTLKWNFTVPSLADAIGPDNKARILAMVAGIRSGVADCLAIEDQLGKEK